MREDLALANFLRILLESIASLQTIFLHFSLWCKYESELNRMDDISIFPVIACFKFR